MLIQVNKFVTMSYFLESSIPAILFTFGRDKAPENFYERSSLAHSQVDFIRERKISPKTFSAAEDLVAVEGNLFVKKKQGNLLNDLYFVISSKYLVQDNPQNKITGKRVKALESKSLVHLPY